LSMTPQSQMTSSTNSIVRCGGSNSHYLNLEQPDNKSRVRRLSKKAKKSLVLAM
jgi:hypothetical protein